MKTIKVIDVLVAANKEYDKLPKKIKYFGTTYELKGNRYYNSKVGFLINPYYIGRDDDLNEEIEIIEEPILDEKEKEYLSYVIKPFRDRVRSIAKCIEINIDKEYILIAIDGYGIGLPYFKKNSMYKGMELEKKYSLEELEL